MADVTSRFFITNNGLGGGHGASMAEALEAYTMALAFQGIRWAYRGYRSER